MKRIAFLGRGVHTIPSYREMLNRLANEYDITVFCETPIDPSWLKSERRYKLVSWCVPFLSLQLNSSLLFLSLVWYHLIRKFDLVHAHSTYPTGFSAVIFQNVFRVPAIVSLDGGEGVGFPNIKFGDLNSQRRTRINKWVLTKARVVATLTNFHRSLVERDLKIDRHIVSFPRGVDTDLFRRKEVTGNSGPIRFLSVGYLSPIKDPVTLLRTFQLILARIPSTLTVVGKDFMNGEIQNLARQFGLEPRMVFIDHVEHRKIQTIYEKADILLHTSLYESQGIVVAEAMACGVVVCGTNVGLIHDLSDECCVRSPVGDEATLANRIIELIGDPDRMNTMREKAYDWTSNFSLEKTVGRWHKLYHTVIEKPK